MLVNKITLIFMQLLLLVESVSWISRLVHEVMTPTTCKCTLYVINITIRILIVFVKLKMLFFVSVLVLVMTVLSHIFLKYKHAGLTSLRFRNFTKTHRADFQFYFFNNQLI